MATVLFAAAGSAIGGSIGGSLLGVGAATLGRAAGAIAGSLIDQRIMGSGAAPVDVGKARALRIQSSTEGAPIARVFGRMRVAGQVIWSTRFQENVRSTSQGGKAATPAQKVNEYSYTISFAVGLCEGPVDRMGRVWADGKLLDLTTVNHRLYTGDDTQLPDPKIEAVEGSGQVPAYRGLAYVVFEDLDVGAYGNRIPQLSFEVFRTHATGLAGEEAGIPVPDLVEAVTISPGTGEFTLDPQPARVIYPAGGGKYANINNPSGHPDMVASLDQLDADLPNCQSASLVVSWFGDDLRCGRCRIEPKIEEQNRQFSPDPWSVSGLNTTTARLVSTDDQGAINFGGTPSDQSVVRAITELSNRGKSVMLYPFLLMDIPAGNGLDDPYGGSEQSAFPWRGRITLDMAPGQTGSVDKTAAAVLDVANFFGSASASDFQIGPGTVTYTGPDEWTWRRFVLHMAALGAAAGGVDAICIGTELRSLTTIRSGVDSFPAVIQLKALAAEVRAILPNAKLTYAADWSEYFGFHPDDGSGDVLFHLDPLWSDVNIDAVGVDDYTPLSDWRYETGHLDEAAKSVYSLPYLAGQVAGGEYFDWYYASDVDRAAQVRSPIDDGAHGEPWVFRPKDFRSWWENRHHNRIGGVRSANPTDWVPSSKPIWLTEVGCPAVDLGSNMPNLFVDEKSSESALPTSSRGVRDDEIQRRFLQAKLGHWIDASNNPISSIYGGPMVPLDQIYVWTWDARPWPDFPIRESIWSDGQSHRLGHWITGRVTAGALSDVVAEICLSAGLAPEEFDVSNLYGMVDGYLIDRTGPGREALQPLMQVFGFDAYESGGQIVFTSRRLADRAPLKLDRLIFDEAQGRSRLERTRERQTTNADAIRLNYVQSEADYRIGGAEARGPFGDSLSVSESSMQIAMAGSRAQDTVDRWLVESLRGQDSISFQMPPSALEFEPGDVVEIKGSGPTEAYRIDRITDLGVREVSAARIEPALYVSAKSSERRVEPALASPPGPLDVVLLDLPNPLGDGRAHQPRIAVCADPWPGTVAIYKSSTTESYSFAGTIQKPAFIGQMMTPVPPAEPGRWFRGTVEVRMPAGSLSSASRLATLNGVNVLAAQRPDDEWELLQFQKADLIGENLYRLTGLLRGQRGTSGLPPVDIPTSSPVVLIDDAVQPLDLDRDELGLRRSWKFGPAQFDQSHPAFVELTLDVSGIGLRPFAPAHLRARWQGNDLAITWVRTDRSATDSLQAVSVPLSEDREAYRVQIRVGQTIVRSVEVEQAGFVYSAAMRLADGASGSVSIVVAQLSTEFGYGLEKVIQIDV